MAFTLTSAGYKGRYMYLSCEQTKDAASNTSTLKWTLTVTGGASNYYSTGPTTVELNGQQVYYCARKSYSTKAFPAAAGSVSGTVTVAHNDDGSCAVPVSLSTAIYDTAVETVSGSWVLESIPRASTIGATAAFIGQVSAITVAQKSKAYTHSVAYRFGSLSGYIAADGSLSDTEVKFSDTSIAFTLPESFYAQIPNSPEGTCTLTCRTYSGTTQIGNAQSCSFTVTAKESLCAPEVTGTVVDVNEATLALTGDETVLVRYMSTAQCTISAEAKNGASIVSRTIGGTAVSGTVRTIEAIEDGSVVFTATDSRGYSASKTVSASLVPYIQLTNNAAVKRTDPTSGGGSLTLKGNYYNGSFGAADNFLEVSYSVDGGEQIPVALTPGDTGYETVISLEGLEYQLSHTVTVTVSDALSEVTRTLTVGKGIPVFDWGENDFSFHVPVGFDSAVSGAYIRAVYLGGSSSITVQTSYAAFGSGTGRQSFFLFGTANGVPIHGLITVHVTDGAAVWSGTGDVTITAGAGGQLTVKLPNPAWDQFILLSGKNFSIL